MIGEVDPSVCVLVLCHDRPEYLQRTLDSLEASLANVVDRPAVVISQDGDDPFVRVVADSWCVDARARLGIDVRSIVHSRVGLETLPNGYHYIARHVRLGIDHVIVENGHSRVIVVEDDLELAPDFFGYFEAAAAAMEVDPTVLAVCGFNEIGQKDLVAEPARVLRSDCFSSLGWMIDESRWIALRQTWPEAYWDDWLRDPDQRAGRSVLCPEVSRVRTFGRDGVSGGQFFDRYLAESDLNDVVVDWASADISRWLLPRYRADLRADIDSAERVDSIGELYAAHNGSPSESSTGGVVAAYAPAGIPGSARESVAFAAHLFGFVDDPRGGVIRGSLDGVISFVHRGRRKFLVPKVGG